MRKACAPLVGVLACLLLTVASPARAQEGDPPAATDEPPTFALADQPATVGPRDLFPLRLRVRAADYAALDVRVRLHENIGTRSGFEETVAGEALGDVVDTAEVSLAGAPRRKGIVTARFGMEDAYIAAAQRIEPGEAPAVYPLEVELLASDNVLDEFVTWLVYLPEGAADDPPIPQPLSVSWVWSVVAPPAKEADGVTPDPDVLAAMRPGGRLDAIASMLQLADDVPLTLDVSPETLESWLEFAQDEPELTRAANALRIAAGEVENQLLPAPYVPIDLPAFEHSGFGNYYAEERAQGAQTMRNLTGRSGDPRVVYAEPVDDASLQRLRTLTAESVLVREERLEERQSNLTPAQPFTLATESGAEFDAAATNPTVTQWLEEGGAPALRAQRFLAGLSLIAMEAPATARGIVVTTPREWAPDVNVVAKVLRGLRTDPLLRPSTLARYFDRVDPELDDETEEPVVRRLGPSEPGEQPITVAEYEAARRSLDSFGGVVGTRDASIERGNRALLVALTSMFTPERAHQELAVIEDAAASFLDQISITQQRVTLTARRAEIPLTFDNGTGQPVRVRVLLAAPSGKALFPDGAEQLVTLANGPQTKRFRVEARATGTFAMTVTLTSEDGALPIGAPTEITVRSTVFSGWGAALTIGALVFLAGWWANHLFRSRRAARKAIA